MSLSLHAPTHTSLLVPVIPLLSPAPESILASEVVNEYQRCQVIVQRVAQQRSLSISEPITLDHLTLFLAQCLRQHVHSLLVLPWDVQQPAVRCLRRTLRAFAYTGMRPVCRAGMLPAIAMPDVSVQGPLGSFLPPQPRLNRCVEQWPGWQQVYTLVHHEQASLLLLHPSAPPSPGQQHARASSDTERRWKQAVAACGEPAPAALPSQRETTLRRDGALFARYLTGIVCAAYDVLQTRSAGVPGEAVRV